jgi:hypothetical protein
MLNTYDWCPMKFFSEYILGFSGPSGLAANKGTICHKVFETLACIKKAQQDGEECYHDKEIGLNNLNMDIDVDWLIEKVYAYYSTAWTHIKWTHDSFKDCRNWVWQALNFNDGVYDPRNLTIVNAEPAFDIELQNEWAHYEYNVAGERLEGQLRLKGTIDLVHEVSDGVIEIVDWKTSARRFNWATEEEKTYEKLREDMQLRIYHLAAHYLYPQYSDVLVTIYFIRAGGPSTVNLSRLDIPYTLDKLREYFEKIKNTDVPETIFSWKCNKLCHQRQSTFENTNVLPIVEKRDGKITPRGKVMSKCEELRYIFQYRDMANVIANMTKDGYSASKYKNPGSV